MASNPSPEQARLNQNVPAATIYSAVPTTQTMTDQWKPASGYVTGKVWNDIEYVPGSTAQMTRRLHPLDVKVPDSKLAPVIWPPPFAPVPKVTLAPPPAYAGPHLKLLKITASRPGPALMDFVP